MRRDNELCMDIAAARVSVFVFLLDFTAETFEGITLGFTIGPQVWFKI